MNKTMSGGLVAAGLMALAWPQGAMAATGACTNPTFLKDAQSAMLAYTQDDQFTGSILVAVDGKPALRQGYGLADRELGAPNTPQTRFRIGSITKQFTAAAILQLQEAGKLSIDDPLSKYYADAPPAWSKVTLRHLLTHSSGIPSYTNSPEFFIRISREQHTTEDLIKLVRDKPMLFEPGKGYSYDNTGYLLLGYIVEKVSGQSYQDYLRQHIFGPLGMTGTGLDDPLTILPDRASGYTRGPDGNWRNAPFIEPSAAGGAGALYSTVDDLLTWDQALNSDRVLSAATRKAMFTDYGNQYGLGWNLIQQLGELKQSHLGSINGFQASIDRYTVSHITSIALSNEQSGASANLTIVLASLCMGKKPYQPEAPETAANLKRFAGYYQMTPAVLLKVEQRGGNLVAHVAGQPATAVMTWFPKGGGKFFGKTVTWDVAFETGPGGQVTDALVALGPRPPMAAQRLDASEGERRTREIAARVAARIPTPGSEEALRQMLGQLQQGDLDLSRFAPDMVENYRKQSDRLHKMLTSLGELKSVTFAAPSAAGLGDIFSATYDKGTVVCTIMFDDKGKILALAVQPPI